MSKWSITLASAMASVIFLCADSRADTGVHLWLEKGDKFKGELSIDSKAVCSFDLISSHDGMQRKPTCTFEMPKNAKHAVLVATLTRAKSKKMINLKDQWQLHDAAEFTSPLYDAKLGIAQRMLKFSEQLKALDAKHSSSLLKYADFSAFEAKARSALSKDFDAAEKRLGFALPKALHDMLSLVVTKIRDSDFHAPKDLVSVEQMLLKEWDYKNLAKLLSVETLARYRRSVAVLTEVSSGLGALAYDPQGVKAGEPSNAWGDTEGTGAVANKQGVWFWVHESHINEPVLLLDRDGRPRSHELSLLAPLQRISLDIMLESIAERGIVKFDDKKSIWIDSSHPKAMLQLHVDDDKRKARLWLRSYDHHYSLL